MISSILTTAEYPAVRDSLGFSAAEIPDSLIDDPQFAPSADLAIKRRVKNWAAILNLAAPAAPSVAPAAVTSSPFVAGTYPVALVAFAGDTPSPQGAIADCVLTAPNQAIMVNLPAPPGITSFDIYVGLGAGITLYRQERGGSPGIAISIETYRMDDALPAQDDRTALKSAAISVCCANLCSRFQQKAPATLKTLTYEEQHTHDWRVEELKYRKAARYYLGLISTYIVAIPPGTLVAGGERPSLIDFGEGPVLSSFRNSNG